MPFVRILPSVVPPGAVVATLLSEVAHAAAEHLGKPERLMMTRLEPAAPMSFAGSAAPCCFVDVHLIGVPPKERADALSQGLCEIVGRHLGIERGRVFVVLTDVPRERWGVDGRMLG